MDLERTASHLATGLARVAVAVHVAGDGTGEGAEAQLERTIAQQQVLLLLSRRRDVYPLTDLSADLGMTTQATLAAITTLHREGMVDMGPSPSYAPHDMRVALTERGRTNSPELLNWAADLLAELHNLDESGQRRLLSVVTDQIRRLQRQNQIPVTKMCVTCRFFDGYAHPGSSEPHHCWLVDGAFGHQQLRLRCPEAQPTAVPGTWQPNGSHPAAWPPARPPAWTHHQTDGGSDDQADGRSDHRADQRADGRPAWPNARPQARPDARPGEA